MALSIQPVGVLYGDHFTRIALLVTNLLGDTKAEWYASSVSECMAKAADLATWPDTIVYVYDTDNNGERFGLPTARISRNGLVGEPQYTTF